MRVAANDRSRSYTSKGRGQLADTDEHRTEDQLRRLEHVLRLLEDLYSSESAAHGLRLGLLNDPGMLDVPWRRLTTDWRRRELGYLGGYQGEVPDEELAKLDAQVSTLALEVTELRREIVALRSRLESSQAVNQRMAREFTALSLQLSRARNLGKVKFHRVISASIYLEHYDPLAGEHIFRHLSISLENAGFSMLLEEPAIISSWFKRFFAKSKDIVTSDQIQQRLAKVEEAIELKNIDLVKSERDKNQSEAVLNLSKAFENQKSAIVMTGSLLFLKVDGPNGPVTLARTLTRDQQDIIESRPELATDPIGLHALLTKQGTLGPPAVPGP